MDAWAVAAALGRRLCELDYDSQHLRLRLGRIPERLTPSAVAPARRRAGDDELGALIRFWNLGSSFAEADLASALGSVPIGDLESAGLIERDGRRVQATLRIGHALNRLLAHDFDRGGSLPTDHVLGVGAATRTLASLTPRG
jgi:hypothetical protein